MTSVQDHATVIKELSDKRQQDLQLTQTGLSQTKPRDIPDSPRPLTSTSETLQESSPPRFSQLPGPPPGNFESSPSRRGPSTRTNSATLVSFPGTGPASNVTVGPGSAQNAPMIQDRNQPVLYDPIQGDSTVQVYLPDEASRRVSVPRPRPVFIPTQDGNGTRGTPRGVSGADSFSDPHEPEQPAAQVKTYRARLEDTLTAAKGERDKYEKQARFQTLTINGAIGLQVVVGAITTGVAAASTNIGAAVAVLGGISTALASYLAKARGSGEPEFSTLRSRELNTFIREVNAFIMDHGDEAGSKFDWVVTMYRQRFETIIKTEGEDSASGGHGNNSRSQNHGSTYAAGQQGMPGGYGGGSFQAGPPQRDGGYGHMSEKQTWNSKNEKAMSGMV